MNGTIVREYRCEKCGRLFRTTNLQLSGRIVCWQTSAGNCAQPELGSGDQQ